MLPLLTFASGIVAGILGVRLLKNPRRPTPLKQLGHTALGGLGRAGEGLREATLSGLSAIEKSSASLRAQLAAPPEASGLEEVDAPSPDVPAAAFNPAEPAGTEPAAAESATAKSARSRRKTPPAAEGEA